ncbi:ABC transporter substrate-binding protein [Orrella sp. JC864]|uniref:ABC transporter substrate-binding protein n=1 Tax=Orrella sp. JC864 TaxID=3120298 RepID=UPI00300AB572
MTGFAGTAQAADAPQCEVNRPVKFGGMNWESNLVLVEVQRTILEKGFGCQSEVLPTETLPALAALERGDLDVNTEIWLNSVADPWKKAEATGRVKRVNDLFMGGEAWFIPRYTAERLPELKTAADLPRFKDEFADPEQPGKGRFYGCPAGWGCEVVSGNLYRALGLQDSFTLYSPGTGAAQKAALTSAYKRKQNVVFYYWYPTPLVGALDLVKLELPEYDAAKHECLTAAKCEDPQPSAYPENPVFTALNAEFMRQAPNLTTFFSSMELENEVVDEMLAHMEASGDDAEQVAEWFLKNKPAVWSAWLPKDVAERVQASL